MKSLLLKIWIMAVGVEPDYTVEIIRRQNLMIRSIRACETYGQLEACKRAIPLYIEIPFPPTETEAVRAILNSHIAWRRFELMNEPKQGNDEIQDKEFDDDKYDKA